jgi:uncharacterized membrane protein YphA (DoxX/SURF4 family)
MKRGAPVLRLGLRLLLGGLFVYAGASKMADPGAFEEAIVAYRLVGREIAMPLAHYLPWVEVVCGLALASGWRRVYRGGLWVGAGLTGLFIGALGSAVWRGLDIDCGCFGAGAGNDPRFELGLVAMIGVALVALIRCSGRDRLVGSFRD